MSARYCYDDHTEEQCKKLAEEMDTKWSHYPGETCDERGCPGGGVC